MSLVKHVIPNVDEDLVGTIPKGLDWNIEGENLVFMVPRYPADEAFAFIEWCAVQGIEHKWQHGHL
ncbi:MAG: hypothetical protein UU98_C0021G0016 [Parcubacteria group bacterium GW2011_GWD2_42_14]|nr:MAG: hypothetical protein UU98_C0021G0016 [Parcubacteria group bacterium GW2011_GWD2_42_14]